MIPLRLHRAPRYEFILLLANAIIPPPQFLFPRAIISVQHVAKYSSTCIQSTLFGLRNISIKKRTCISYSIKVNNRLSCLNFKSVKLFTFHCPGRISVHGRNSFSLSLRALGPGLTILTPLRSSNKIAGMKVAVKFEINPPRNRRDRFSCGRSRYYTCRCVPQSHHSHYCP